MKVTEGSIQKGDSVGTNGNVFSLLKTTWKLIVTNTSRPVSNNILQCGCSKCMLRLMGAVSPV